MFGSERWNLRGGHGNVYRWTKEVKRELGRNGRKFKPDDLCIRIADAGDCFHDYIVMRPDQNGLYKRVSDFGAYVFGEPIGTLKDRPFHLACAGEPVDLNDPNNYEEKS